MPFANEKALGRTHLQTLRIYHFLVRVLRELEKTVEAEEIEREHSTTEDSAPVPPVSSS